MNLTPTEALEYVQPFLKQSRFEHTKRVTATAILLARRFGANAERAEMAAILHDYAKYKPLDEMKRWIVQDPRLPKDLLHYHHELWHGPVGAYMLEKEVGLHEVDVISAIACHTTGKKHMSKLDKVVFLADYIEPGREFPGVNEVRDIANTDLERACLLALQNTIVFLINNNRTVYPDTFHAYNSLL